MSDAFVGEAIAYTPAQAEALPDEVRRRREAAFAARVGEGHLAADDPGWYGPGGEGGREVVLQSATRLRAVARQYGFRHEGPRHDGREAHVHADGRRLFAHPTTLEWEHVHPLRGNIGSGQGLGPLRRHLETVTPRRHVVRAATRGVTELLDGAGRVFGRPGYGRR
jgi:hypothetical protein